MFKLDYLDCYCLYWTDLFDNNCYFGLMIYVNKADIGFYRFSKIDIVFETNTA